MVGCTTINQGLVSRELGTLTLIYVYISLIVINVIKYNLIKSTQFLTNYGSIINPLLNSLNRIFGVSPARTRARLVIFICLKYSAGWKVQLVCLLWNSALANFSISQEAEKRR